MFADTQNVYRYRKYANVYHYTKCLPIHKMFTDTQNVYRYAKMFTDIQNVYRYAKCLPLYKNSAKNLEISVKKSLKKKSS